MVKKNLFKIALIASAIVTVVTTPVKADEERKFRYETGDSFTIGENSWCRRFNESDNTRNFIEGIDICNSIDYSLYEGYEVASIDEHNNGEEWGSSPEECKEHYFSLDKNDNSIVERCKNAILIDGQDPTCTEDGETPLVICKECGIIVNEGGDKMPKLGHEEYEMNNYVLPTCSKEGHENDIGCSRCGKVIRKGEKIPKQPHSPDYNSEEILKGETLKSEGKRRMVCEDCGADIFEAIPKLKLSKPVIRLSTTSTGIKVNWNSTDEKTEGYEIQVSKNKNMSSCDTYNFSEDDKSMELYDLGSYTNYYVRARIYTFNSKDEKVCSYWTSPKRIRTRKTVVTNAKITRVNSQATYLSVYLDKSIPSFSNRYSVWKSEGTLSNYELRYSTNKNMKNAKKFSNVGIGNTCMDILNLKPNTTYYIQVRRFVAKDNKGYQWSKWSKTFKAKTLPLKNKSTCKHNMFKVKNFQFNNLKTKKVLKGDLRVVEFKKLPVVNYVCDYCGKTTVKCNYSIWNNKRIVFDNRHITDYHKAATSLADYMISHHYKGINKHSYTKKDKADLVYCIEKVLKGDGNSYKNDELSYKRGNVNIKANTFLVNRSYG